jgi:hypothetical protein
VKGKANTDFSELFTDDGNQPEMPTPPGDLYWPDPDYDRIVRDLAKAKIKVPNETNILGFESPLDVFRRRFLDQATALKPELLKELRKAGANARKLKAWKEKWHLAEPWCMRLLLAPPLLPSWYRDAQLQFFLMCQRLRREYGDSWAAQLHEWHEPPRPGFRSHAVEIRFSYDPERDRRSDLRDRLIKEVEAAVKELCDETIARGLEMSMKPTPSKRVRRKGVDPKPDQHFNWLARYQLEDRETWWTIAHKTDCNWRAVKKAIVKTADQIGLKWRRKPAHRGK